MFSLNDICKCIFAGFVCLLLLISCTTTKQTLYLQEIEISGPINQAPIHLTDSIDTPSVIISPRFSVNTQKNLTANTGGHSMVNTNGVFQVINVLIRTVFLLFFSMAYFTRDNNVIIAFLVFSLFVLVGAIILMLNYKKLTVEDDGISKDLKPLDPSKV